VFSARCDVSCLTKIQADGETGRAAQRRPARVGEGGSERDQRPTARGSRASHALAHPHADASPLAAARDPPYPAFTSPGLGKEMVKVVPCPGLLSTSI
jgi:hypothetical protein